MHAQRDSSFWSLLLGVSHAERQPLLWSFLYFFCVLASYYVLRPLRDEMGVAGGVDQLPWLFLGTLTVTLLLAPVFATLVARLPRQRFVAWAYRGLGLCLLGFAAAFYALPDSTHVWIGRVFFVWLSVFNLFAVSLFWAVMADVFRSEHAQRLFGLIAAGGTLGGLAGGLLTATLVQMGGALPLLGLAIVLLEGALLCMRRLGAHLQAHDRQQAALEQALIGGHWYAGFQAAARSPYLLGMVVFMLLFTVGSTFLYLLQAEVVAAAIPERAARAAYFAQVDVWVNALTLGLQLLWTGRALRRLGVGLTVALLPIVSLIGFAALALAPVLTAVVVFQVARRVADFALSRPARELLYIPLSREDKYKAKSLIDTFAYRAGDQLGAFGHAGLVALGLAASGIAWVGAALSLVWIVLALWLGRQHRQLIESPTRPGPERPIDPVRPALLPTGDPLH